MNLSIPSLLSLSLVCCLTFSGMVGYGQQGLVVYDSIKSKYIVDTPTHERQVRKVVIYLPPGYESSTKRYPVLYLLHGIGDDPEVFTGDTSLYNNIQSLMDHGSAIHKFGEMIIVMPDEKTNWFGSFFTNSASTGNWEDFTARELVDYVDLKYRTIAKPEARAIAGHSMGGYGAITLAMQHPDIFNVTYGMNAALFCFCGELVPSNPHLIDFIKAKDHDQLLKTQNQITVGLLTVAQAFSGNKSNPPFFADKPFKVVDGKVVRDRLTYDRWLSRDPVRMANENRKNLLKLRAIKFDSGNQDEYLFIVQNNRLFSKKLTELNVPHQFEEYNGDHRNKLWGLHGRIYNDLLPFVFENVAR